MAIYASDTPGGAAQAYMADAASRRNSFLSALGDAVQQRNFLQTRADQNSRFQQELAVNQALTEAQQRRQAFQDTLAQRYHDQEAGWHEDEISRQIGRDQMQGKLWDAQIAAMGTRETPAGRDRNRTESAFVEDAINNGRAVDWNLVPTITPEQRQYYEGMQQDVAHHFGEQQKVADAGNLADKIAAVAAKPPLPTSARRLFNPLTWLNANGVSSDEVMQPSDEALARRNAIHKAVATALNSGEIQQDPATGRYFPALRQPVMAAPVVGPAVSYPGAAPAGGYNLIDPSLGGARPAATPSAPKQLTSDIAAQYLKRLGNRKAAEAAAQADGYQW